MDSKWFTGACIECQENRESDVEEEWENEYYRRDEEIRNKERNEEMIKEEEMNKEIKRLMSRDKNIKYDPTLKLLYKHGVTKEDCTFYDPTLKKIVYKHEVMKDGSNLYTFYDPTWKEKDNF